MSFLNAVINNVVDEELREASAGARGYCTA